MVNSHYIWLYLYFVFISDVYFDKHQRFDYIDANNSIILEIYLLIYVVEIFILIHIIAL